MGIFLALGLVVGLYYATHRNTPAAPPPPGPGPGPSPVPVQMNVDCNALLAVLPAPVLATARQIASQSGSTPAQIGQFLRSVGQAQLAACVEGGKVVFSPPSTPIPQIPNPVGSPDCANLVALLPPEVHQGIALMKSFGSTTAQISQYLRSVGQGALADCVDAGSAVP